jgi:hypothetical protein
VTSANGWRHKEPLFVTSANDWRHKTFCFFEKSSVKRLVSLGLPWLQWIHHKWNAVSNCWLEQEYE